MGGENITYDYIDFKELLKAKDPELMEMLALYNSSNGTYLSPYELKINGTYHLPYYFKRIRSSDDFVTYEVEYEDEDEVHQDGKNEYQVHQDDYDGDELLQLSDDELLQLSDDELLQHLHDEHEDDDYD